MHSNVDVAQVGSVATYPAEPTELPLLITPILGRVRTVTLHFEIEFLADAVLPRFKGSMIRGAIGRAFRHSMCVCRQVPGSVCPYHTIFETRAADDAFQFLSRVDQVPHPYLFEVPFTDQQFYRAGERFPFSMRLFGFATDVALNLIAVVMDAGRHGLTKQSVPFRIVSVRSVSADGTSSLVYDGETMRYHSLPAARYWKPENGHSNPSALRLHLVTPATFVRRGRLQSRITFSDIVTSLVRRTVAVAHYAEGIQGLPAVYQGERLSIDDVAVTEQSFAWVDVPRYSNKQHTEMQFGGIVGEAVFTGNLTPWIPLVQFGTLMHVGKRTTFGFGLYSVELL